MFQNQFSKITKLDIQKEYLNILYGNCKFFIIDFLNKFVLYCNLNLKK